MKFFKSDNGFTLIETLVSINLIVLVTSLVILFYLVSAKFISSVSNNFQESQNLFELMNKLEEVQQKSRFYNVYLLSDSLLVNFDNNKYFLLKSDTLDLDNNLVIYDISEPTIEFGRRNGNKTIYRCESSGINQNEIQSFSSDDIKYFLISFLKDNNKYDFTFYNTRESIKEFQNIRE